MYKSLRSQALHYFARPHERVLLEPLNSPAAWRGDTLRQSMDWQVLLDATEVDELKSAVKYARDTKKPLGQLNKEDLPLSMALSHRIDDWRREILHGRGFVLLRGLPLEDWTEGETECFFWCFGHHLGIPGAQNPECDLLTHVRDVSTDADARYYKTNKNIAPHCDAADAVGLLCLQTARSGGLSRIVSSVSVYNELLQRCPSQIQRLYQPFYLDTYGGAGLKAFPIAPCRYSDDQLRTFWHSDYYRTASRHAHVPSLNCEEQTLLDEYDRIAASPELYLEMDLQPGDIQILSNHTVLHSRTAFEDWPELERKRHLLRLWISLPEKRRIKTRLRAARCFMGLGCTLMRELARARLTGS